MAAEKDEAEGANEERGEHGEAAGRLSPRVPARSSGQAGAQVCGRVGVRGGHLLLPTGEEEDDRERAGLGQVSDR